jgi:iron(III) transport system ATP-binding protein
VQTLRIENLLKVYSGQDKVVAVDRINLTVEDGMLLVLLGPSGCGKTTLLRCVAGLEDAQDGTITLGDKVVLDVKSRLNLPTHKRDIGLVFQNYSLWPHMTVRRNVDYPLRARGVERTARDRRVDEVLDMVQCRELADRLPSMLSGGQQQRIALARALAPRPAIMLLDEPLSNLDALLREDLRAQLRGLHRELGFTGIYVTHDQTEAFALGSRVAVMNAGRVEQYGTPDEVYQAPMTEYVARFLGIRNRIALQHDGYWTSEVGPLSGDLAVLGNAARGLLLYARPGHVGLSRQALSNAARTLGLPPAVVKDVLYMGGEVEYLLQAQDVVLHAKAPISHDRFQPGDLVYPSIAHDHALIYADGRLTGR